MNNDDPFRDWLAETKKYADDNWDPTLIDVLDDVIAAYERIAALPKPGMNDDSFRDWLVDEIADLRDDHAYYLGRGERWTARMTEGKLIQAEYILDRCDIMNAAEAEAVARTANHADTTEAPRTDDPGNDQAAYERRMAEYQDQVARIVAVALVFDNANRDVIVALVFDSQNRDVIGKDIRERSQHAARTIAALPKPVKGGEG